MSFTSTAINITPQCVPIERRFEIHNKGEHATQEKRWSRRGGIASCQDRLVPRLTVATCFAGVIKANAGGGWC